MYSISQIVAKLSKYTTQSIMNQHITMDEKFHLFSIFGRYGVEIHQICSVFDGSGVKGKYAAVLILTAHELLKELEKGRENMSGKDLGKVKVNPIQLSMFQLDDPVLLTLKEQLQQMDLNSISPIEALLKLNELKKMLNT